jgi:MFS family permease
VVARAIAFTIMLQGLAIDSLAALALTGDASISTLPMTASQLGNVLAAMPASMFMRRWGRRAGFLVGGVRC